MLNILFVGDVNGKPGREALKAIVPSLVKEKKIDFVIANGENSAAGFGITDSTFTDMLSAGVDAVTLGNHLYDKKEALPMIENDSRLVRPANLPEGNPGRGFSIFTINKDSKRINIAVANLTGRIFMAPVDCPFRAADRFIKDIGDNARVIIVDMHAEATSEKIAMGFYLDGRVTAVLGTHTHVMTADERVLEKGTAYISDAGMTGPFDSVIGVKKEIILRKFLTGMPERFEIAEDDVRLNAVLIAADEATGRAASIERIQIKHG
ncbi:MAG: TIGR00282 family metallophosphoesterase [Spirochaetia bacterium]|nr:TIGR00282 family metallophosphoesterase [Spirochaetia bacterium]